MKKGRPKSNITASNQYVWLILCNSEWYKLDFASGNNPNYAFALLVN